MKQFNGIETEAFMNKAQKVDRPPLGFSASDPLERDWFLGLEDKPEKKNGNNESGPSASAGSSLAKQYSGAEIADRLSERRNESKKFNERKRETKSRLSEAEEYNVLRRHRNPSRKKLLMKAFLLSLYTPGHIGIVSLILQYLQCTKGYFLLFFIISLIVGIARFYTQYQMLEGEFWEEAAKENPNIAKLVDLGGIEALGQSGSRSDIPKRQTLLEKKND
ncbi:hypothetical protein SOMG_04936 [Schizosaccharomyces osmophilus]|uniref:Uncharacterized protein n=1 Tax=Schizosaccharomyces osmophilus TaxID=2545709 RepID=A0AAE9WEA4_9SCHI|nr:uncharacterized protein SOMG_04936 [Schizosaccharomyces osmophilus]WBW74816.1 hypothetical protein SOMG_04936 [Schizosaccharomyces osmophilus]